MQIYVYNRTKNNEIQKLNNKDNRMMDLSK